MKMKKIFNLAYSFVKNYSQIILASSSFILDHFFVFFNQKLNEKNIKKQVSKIIIGDVNENSVEKIISKINASNILENSSIIKQTKAVEKFLENLSKGNKAEYGFSNVLENVEKANCETLITTTKFLEDRKEKKDFEKVSNLFLTLESLNGELIILNSKSQNGKIVDGISGICLILRY